jgi:hypothetical protein
MPPFLFHYIILCAVVSFITAVCVLKFKYLYWYSQPVTFRFTGRRWFGGGGHRTTIMNPLSLGERCYNVVVYSFLTQVNHQRVRVYRGTDEDIPFERIAELLSSRGGGGSDSAVIAGGQADILRLLLSQGTFGLSAFIGILWKPNCQESAKNNTTPGSISGISILTPRIMISFHSSQLKEPYRSVSIYMCDYLAWSKYTVSELESLELLETTEYIQKSREIAGEQTLYRYNEIPWFVVPFTTVYSYLFAGISGGGGGGGGGLTVVPVSSTNFALFYAFITERTRDFHCCILNELTQLQSLVEHKLYRIYLLLWNETRVVASYLFTRSVLPESKDLTMNNTVHPAESSSSRLSKKKTKGNRIHELHDYISKTSTALVKYLPPVIPTKYDVFGKRISEAAAATGTGLTMGGGTGKTREERTVLRLISSIQHKAVCDTTQFLYGFQTSYSKETTTQDEMVMIDTLAHNYRLIDAMTAMVDTMKSTSPRLVSQEKWYYILYNAIIHKETLCKDILMI